MAVQCRGNLFTNETCKRFCIALVSLLDRPPLLLFRSEQSIPYFFVNVFNMSTHIQPLLILPSRRLTDRYSLQMCKRSKK
jgi:hypothetical protein